MEHIFRFFIFLVSIFSSLAGLHFFVGPLVLLIGTMPGPLFLVSLGFLYPCFEKEENRSARQAITYINTHSKILWFAKREQNPSFIKSFFTKEQKDGSKATIQLVDNDDAYPEILVTPDKIQEVGYKLNLLLRRVDRVSADNKSGQITLFSRKPKDGPPKELLHFLVLDNSGMPIVDDQRNLFVHHLSVMVEWERQQRPIEDWEEEEEGNFLQAHTKKAAHFAQREVELQKVKRDRESRKAKLVQESGGLKYTALAMANREN